MQGGFGYSAVVDGYVLNVDAVHSWSKCVKLPPLLSKLQNDSFYLFYLLNLYLTRIVPVRLKTSFQGSPGQEAATFIQL